MLVSVSTIPNEQRKKRAQAAQLYMAEHKTWDAQAAKIAQFINTIAADQDAL